MYNPFMGNAKAVWSFFGILILLMLCYYPALIINYAHHDDYWYLWKTSSNPYQLHTLHNTLISMGRVLGACTYTGLSWFVHSISDLKIIRFLAIFQLSFAAWILMSFLQKHYLDKWQAFLVTIIIFT